MAVDGKTASESATAPPVVGGGELLEAAQELTSKEPPGKGAAAHAKPVPIARPRNFRFGLIADIHRSDANVRSGSKAEVDGNLSYVRFAPNSRRKLAKSGH